MTTHFANLFLLPDEMKNNRTEESEILSSESSTESDSLKKNQLLKYKDAGDDSRSRK